LNVFFIKILISTGKKPKIPFDWHILPRGFGFIFPRPFLWSRLNTIKLTYFNQWVDNNILHEVTVVLCFTITIVITITRLCIFHITVRLLVVSNFFCNFTIFFIYKFYWIITGSQWYNITATYFYFWYWFDWLYGLFRFIALLVKYHNLRL